MLSPLLETITAEGSKDTAVDAAGKPIELDLVTVNTDVEQELAQEFGVCPNDKNSSSKACISLTHQFSSW